jgi:hypothetical protein
MSALQALAAVEAAKAEWVISSAALSAAMQVKVLISDILQLQCALSPKAAPFYGPAFLEQAAIGVNDFFVQACVAIDDHLIPARACVSMAPGCDSTGAAASRRAPAKLPPAQVSKLRPPRAP